jgi:formamidopyrimidine-DNA glycosylase
MPELPEVETIARGLASRVTGDVIESVWLGSKPEPLKSTASEIVATLESKRIGAVHRVGKHIVFDLENGRRAPIKRKSSHKSLKASVSPSNTAQWIVHLGMTGRMLVCNRDQALEKHTHAVAKLASGRELRFVDPRRFGRLSVAHGFEAAGSEPLEVELEAFIHLFRGRKTPI